MSRLEDKLPLLNQVTHSHYKLLIRIAPCQYIWVRITLKDSAFLRVHQEDPFTCDAYIEDIWVVFELFLFNREEGGTVE